MMENRVLEEVSPVVAEETVPATPNTAKTKLVVPNSDANQTLKTKKFLSKRFCLKRSDSGLSSDSGEQSLPSTDHTDDTCKEEDSAVVSVHNQQPMSIMSHGEDEDLSNSEHSSQIFEFDGTQRYCCDSCEQYYKHSAKSNQKHQPERSFSTEETIFALETKISELTSHNELITKKLLFMEEHMLDLNGENDNLYKKLSTQEEMYKKKIDFREEEIQILKDVIFQLEENVDQCQIKEKQYAQQQAQYLEQIKTMKQQLAEQEVELYNQRNTQRKLAGLEMAYQKATQMIDALKNDKSDTITQLEETFAAQSMAKELIIGNLQKKIEDLKQTLAIDEQSETIQHLHNSDSFVDCDQQSVDIAQPAHHQRQHQFVNYRQLSIYSENNMDIPMLMEKRSLGESISCDTDGDYDSQESVAHSPQPQYMHLFPSMTNGVNLLAELDNNNNNKLVRCKTADSKSETKMDGELFPSLPDVMLRKLRLLRENTCNIESLSEQEIDSKFHTLSLAFKTDKFTLDQRVKLYRHQRDVAENGTKTELANLSNYIQDLSRVLLCCENKFFYKNNNHIQLREIKEMLDKIEMQSQVIRAAVMKISSRAELCGAVRQEEKLSAAFDVILLHLDNLKRAKERDAKELEDLRRLLATSGIKNDSDHSPDEDQFATHRRRAIRQISSTSKINLIRVRRASVASIGILPNEINNLRFGSSTCPTSTKTTATTTTTTTIQNIPVVNNTLSVSQSYLRSRRLSVPAAELKPPRPKLLQMLSNKSNRLDETEEDESKSEDSKDDDESRSDLDFKEFDSKSELDTKDLEEHVTDSEQGVEESVPLINVDELSDDGTLCEPDSRGKRLSITPIISLENTDLFAQTSLPFTNTDLFDNCNDAQLMVGGERKTNRNEKFYKELVKRLEPLEALQLNKTTACLTKVRNKIKLVYKAANESFWVLLVKTVEKTQNSSIARLSKHFYDEIRYSISIVLVIMSIVIIFWSIIMPLML